MMDFNFFKEKLPLAFETSNGTVGIPSHLAAIEHQIKVQIFGRGTHSIVVEAAHSLLKSMRISSCDVLSSRLRFRTQIHDSGTSNVYILAMLYVGLNSQLEFRTDVMQTGYENKGSR